MITSKLIGWKETATLLKELPSRTQKAVLAKAMDEAGKAFEDRARQTTAFVDRSNFLRKSIKLKKKRATPTSVGPDVIASAPHAHLIENGWQQRTKTGTRHIPGKHFMRNTMTQIHDELLKLINSKLKEFIEKKLKRLRG